MRSLPTPRDRAEARPSGPAPDLVQSAAGLDLTSIQEQQHEAAFEPGYDGAICRDIAAAQTLRQHATQAQIADMGIKPQKQAFLEAAKAPKRLADEDRDMSRASKRYMVGPSRFVEDREVSFIAFPNNFVGKYSKLPHTISGGPFTLEDRMLPASTNFDLFSSLCTSRELIINVCSYLKPKDVLSLYKASKLFYEVFTASFKANIWQLANAMAPGAARTFYWKFYPHLLISDPNGTLPTGITQRHVYPWHKEHEISRSLYDPPHGTARAVPSFRWLYFVVDRERKVRDIVACLARSGHRLPRHAHISLKKMWFVMDCATNSLRGLLMRSRSLFSDFDLYNLQMFFIKLQMRFNEPIFGPDSPELVQVLLGQKTGLEVLWGILRKKKYTDDLLAMVQLKIRYDYQLSMDQFMSIEPIHGVSLLEVGSQQFEGWGRGVHHLLRPDELVAEEAAYRGLKLCEHSVYMAIWGFVDIKRKKNLVPTEEEMYMSDDELPPIHPKDPNATCGNVPFYNGEWLPKHAKKARWETLTREEKLQICADDLDEQLRDLIWEYIPPDDESDFDPYDSDSDIVPEDRVRSNTRESGATPAAAAATTSAAPSSSSIEGHFQQALRKSYYRQDQQKAELAALAGVVGKQSPMDIDFDEYMTEVGYADEMDIDEGNNQAGPSQKKNHQKEAAISAAEDDEEYVRMPIYQFRQF